MAIFEPKRKSVTVLCLNAFTHTIPCLHHNFQPIHGLGSLNQSCQRDWSIELVRVFVTTQLYPKKTPRQIWIKFEAPNGWL